VTEESSSKGIKNIGARRRWIVIGVTVVGVAVAAVLGAYLGRGPRSERSAGTEAAARIVAAYRGSLRELREAQRATTDPAELADLAAMELRLRVLTAIGLAGIPERSGEPALREETEGEIREMLSAFADSGGILNQIEGEYFRKLSAEDVEFARDLGRLLEFLVREEGLQIKAKRRELEKLKALEAEMREQLVPGHESHEKAEDHKEGHEGCDHD